MANCRAAVLLATTPLASEITAPSCHTLREKDVKNRTKIFKAVPGNGTNKNIYKHWTNKEVVNFQAIKKNKEPTLVASTWIKDPWDDKKKLAQKCRQGPGLSGLNDALCLHLWFWSRFREKPCENVKGSDLTRRSYFDRPGIRGEKVLHSCAVSLIGNHDQDWVPAGFRDSQIKEQRIK